MLGAEMSTGFVASLAKDEAGALTSFIDVIRHRLTSSIIVHANETFDHVWTTYWWFNVVSNDLYNYATIRWPANGRQQLFLNGHMNMPPSLQIQTVFFNPSQASLDRFLSSVAQAVTVAKQAGSISTATLVAGDCSPLRVFQSAGQDDLVASLREAGLDDFYYEFFDANLGSAGGHNQLFGVGQSDLVLILNPDIVASPQLIAELTLRLSDPKIGLVEGRQLPVEHPKPYDLRSGETPWASTACALIPRSVIAEVGYFDNQSFFLYCDDVDYSWRIRLAGYKIIFHPPARIFHDKRLDNNGNLRVGPAEIYYAAEGALMMAHKWSRPDLVESFLTGLLENGSSLEQEAAEKFLKRKEAGTLPEPIDSDHRVSEFHNGHWTKHRW